METEGTIRSVNPRLIVSLLSIHSYPFEHPRLDETTSSITWYIYIQEYHDDPIVVMNVLGCENTCLSLSLSVCSSNIESVAWQLRGRCFHGRHLDWKLILNVVDATRWVLSWLRYLRLNRKRWGWISKIFWYRAWIDLGFGNVKRSIVWE